MTREEIIQQVNALCAEEFEVPQSDITPEAVVKDTLRLNSLNLVDLVALTQYTYNITIPVGDLPGIQTFNDLYDYIEQHLPK